MNVFTYSATVERNWKANLSDMSGFKPKYTFYNDFAIAEFCEMHLRECGAILKTFKQVLASWGNNYEAMTEVVLVLNHKIWAFFQKVDSKYLGVNDECAMNISKLYDILWRKADEFYHEKFSENKDAMSYYYEVLD